MPNPPLPPRNAQNRSAFSSTFAVSNSPAAVTTRKLRTQSDEKPYVRASGPRPPPRV
ncbi:hypothetical protein JOF29_003468 [Kribbella aluminosa]|uniref:Uncharacterized protein n=1 Tax=Kribbella aluminosa TaxID=416017 RepID=A0ABS4UL66_9ACTN|nr:hypothetical protein [Kribbella aluminosa]MBP2352385.1 hypothetical protein [Kribbella aluminosa]